jgi:HPt (histidine-containing phosphotransfer) domain-containing protein
MIDLVNLAKELDFDVEDMRMLLELYLESARKSLENIQESLHRTDYEVIYSEAHSIKGSSANLMLVDIQNIAKELEEYAKNRQKIQCLQLYTILKEQIYELSQGQNSYV